MLYRPLVNPLEPSVLIDAQIITSRFSVKWTGGVIAGITKEFIEGASPDHLRVDDALIQLIGKNTLIVRKIVEDTVDGVMYVEFVSDSDEIKMTTLKQVGDAQ